MIFFQEPLLSMVFQRFCHQWTISKTILITCDTGSMPIRILLALSASFSQALAKSCSASTDVKWGGVGLGFYLNIPKYSLHGCQINTNNNIRPMIFLKSVSAPIWCVKTSLLPRPLCSKHFTIRTQIISSLLSSAIILKVIRASEYEKTFNRAWGRFWLFYAPSPPSSSALYTNLRQDLR